MKSFKNYVLNRNKTSNLIWIDSIRQKKNYISSIYNYPSFVSPIWILLYMFLQCSLVVSATFHIWHQVLIHLLVPLWLNNDNYHSLIWSDRIRFETDDFAMRRSPIVETLATKTKRYIFRIYTRTRGWEAPILPERKTVAPIFSVNSI